MSSEEFKKQFTSLLHSIPISEEGSDEYKTAVTVIEQLKTTFDKVLNLKDKSMERSGSILPETGEATSIDDRSSDREAVWLSALGAFSKALELLPSKPVDGTGLQNSASRPAKLSSTVLEERTSRFTPFY